MKKYKLLILYIIFSLLLIITGMVFSILGSSERVGYISEFDLREKIDDKYVYNIRVKYYDEKIFRNSDILGVYVKNFTNVIWGGNGSPFGIFTSDKEMSLDDKIDIIYTTKVRNTVWICIIAGFLMILYLYSIIKYVHRVYNELPNKEIYLRSYKKFNKVSLKKISSFIKFNKVSLFILLFLFTVFYFMSYFYPLVYDDISSFSYSTIDSIGLKYMKLGNIYSIIAGMYGYHGRIGHGFIYPLIHMPYIQAFLSSMSILCLYGFFPCIISGNFLSSNRFHLGKYFTFFSVMALLSLLIPWNFYIFNDFFNRTMFLTLVFPIVGFIGTIIFTWYQIMTKQYIHGNIIGYVILFVFGFFISIHSELLTIYGIGMFIGILVLAYIRYKKIPHFSNSIIILYTGVLVGAIIIFTSKGFVNNILGVGSYSRGTTNTMSLILKEIMPVSVLLLITIIVAYVIYYFLSKNKINSSSREDQIEFIYKSLYLFLVWCGFIIILLIAKVPYFRTLVVAATVLPLVYLLLLGVSKIVATIIVPKFFIVVPVLIIAYSLYITIHNIDLMNKVIDDFQKQITIAKETDTDIIVPVYDAPFKHIYTKAKEGTSEMGHGNAGTSKEKQKEGMRLFYHTISLNGKGPLQWKFNFYNYDGELSTNQSVTNKY